MESASTPKEVTFVAVKADGQEMELLVQVQSLIV